MYRAAVQARTLPGFVRSLHASPVSRHLVGPNDPISNLRPIIYTDTPTHIAPPDSNVYHPYSLSEFTDGVPHDYTLELQFKLAREQLDAFNHNYWTDSNTRFEAAKQVTLASLPDSASPEMRENALSEFYNDWVVQERTRQDEYSAEWRKRNFSNIALAARVEYQRFKRRIWG
ncbi:hypothetical protein PAXRUDRAFT_13658 [Paxillus rubicundulus Ve08.2h10]|uniref:Unplaced genomic scaffold scaffold_539, whole genome shotgun sequence n=1 Tax=Paxillus rubicundulus Ve08.2h10 TaxID=930991 RepID=A0A0D0E3L4_9AGAM|nr:hypothetical protein PAXRUDRAFT_13658 [Paxillus rubicundulus Ve08.2h10]